MSIGHLTETLQSLLNTHAEAAVIISGDRNSFDISALLSLDPNRYARNSRPIDSRSYRNQFGALFQRGENCPHNYPQTVLDTELPVIVVWLLHPKQARASMPQSRKCISKSDHSLNHYLGFLKQSSEQKMLK